MCFLEEMLGSEVVGKESWIFDHEGKTPINMEARWKV